MFQHITRTRHLHDHPQDTADSAEVHRRIKLDAPAEALSLWRTTTVAHAAPAIPSPPTRYSIAFPSAAVSGCAGDFASEKFFAKRATIAFVAICIADRL
jgi:hypothetical protein